MEQIETIVAELLALRHSPRLNREQMRRAQHLLVALKVKGYSADKIEEITGGAWKASSVKHYTRGIRSEDSSLPQESLNIVAEMAVRGMDLQQVEKANEIKRIFDAEGVPLDEVAGLIAESRDSGIDVKDIISTVRDARESGISMTELGRTLSYKKSLEGVGINEKKLGQIHGLVLQQGGGSFDETVEFMRTFATLKILQSDVRDVASKKNGLEAEVHSLQSEVYMMQERKQQIQPSLDLYKELEGRGFSKDMLDKILENAKKFGEADQVLEAINLYGSLDPLEAKFEKFTNAAIVERANVNNLRAENLHLRELLKMVDMLLEHEFTIPEIERLYTSAQKYGEPVEVLRALDEYGRLSAIQDASEKARNYDRIEKERDQAVSLNTQLQAKMSSFQQLERDREEMQAKLRNQERRSIQMLEEILSQIKNPQTERKYPQELTGSDLPELVENHIDEEVTERLKVAGNNALKTRFSNEVNKQVKFVSDPWMKMYLGKKTPARMALLTALPLEDPFQVLRGKWPIRCYTCDYYHYLQLESVFDIKALLIKESVKVPADCVSSYLKGSHSVYATLGDIVRLYVERETRRLVDKPVIGNV